MILLVDNCLFCLTFVFSSYFSFAPLELFVFYNFFPATIILLFQSNYPLSIINCPLFKSYLKFFHTNGYQHDSHKR